MKITLYYLIAVMLMIGFIHSCQNDTADYEPKISNFAILYQKQAYQVNNNEGLNAFIKANIGIDRIKIIEPSFEEAHDELGKYYLVKAKYEDEGLITSVTISLTELEESTYSLGRSGAMMLNVDCTMTCTASNGCSGCKQTIATRCESQSCTCITGSPNGICTSSITFGGNEE